ncbi:myelin-associated glycoprotein-like [Anabas testudineus]|uniref:myelin-associated glycoprotein-like n=1 Tax=Anabas testudineus TaxID=64144 RepID=UPI000E45DB49|nr:myelin-associated glycoprotein-like [Anabas testudineus]
MEMGSVLLSLLFVSGALAGCDQYSGLFITAPQKMEALSGSCLMIPCKFRTKEEFISTRTTFGVWMKHESDFYQHPNQVIFNSSGTVNKYPMKITGNLSQKNCTTLFSNLITTYTDTYYFRIENRPVMATAVIDPLQITVKDFPPSPKIKVSGDLKEKESVTISCSAFTPCPHSPPKLTWSLQQDPHNNREENTDGTFTTQIQETITLSDKHDGYNISCSATYPVNEGRDVRTAETQVTLSVSYSPRDTSLISPTDPVSVGSVVNLSCSCRANPVKFVWFLISDGKLEQINADKQVYSFKVTNSDRDRLFYCGCRNDLDIQLSVGHQLMFRGTNLIGLQFIVKILGIGLLVSTLIIFECWFGSRSFTKPLKVRQAEDHHNQLK